MAATEPVKPQRPMIITDRTLIAAAFTVLAGALLSISSYVWTQLDDLRLEMARREQMKAIVEDTMLEVTEVGIRLRFVEQHLWNKVMGTGTDLRAPTQVRTQRDFQSVIRDYEEFMQRLEDRKSAQAKPTDPTSQSTK